jgi:ferredoxin like protein
MSEEGDARSSGCPVNLEEKLGVNKYDVDEGNPHIVLSSEFSNAEFDKLIIACPAGLYKRDEDGVASFDYAGCLECGTCRDLCEGTVVAEWKYPRGTMGIEYRFG